MPAARRCVLLDERHDPVGRARSFPTPDPMNPYPHLPLAFVCAAVLVSLLATRASAQKNLDPEVAALLQKIDRGLGQPARKPRSLVVEGTFAVSFPGAPEPVAKGAFREAFAGNDRARHTSDMGEMGALERGIRGDLVWEVDPAMGAKVHRGAYASAVRRFYGLLAGLSPRDLFVGFERTGTERVGDREHTVLRLTPREGKADTWWVDAEGRVTRVETALPAPESADPVFGMEDLMPATIELRDWRQVGDATLPHARELKMGPATVSFACTSMRFVEAIDEARFAPPDAVMSAEAGPSGPAFGPDGKPIYQTVQRKAQPVVSIRIKCKPSEIADSLSVLLPEVMAHLTATGGKMAGPPFSRYHAWSDTEIDLEAGIPVQKPVAVKGRIQNSELPAGKAVSCWHVGPYDKLAGAHAGLNEYLREQQLESAGGPWEVYWTDPGMVPDAAKWRTQLFMPVK